MQEQGEKSLARRIGIVVPRQDNDASVYREASNLLTKNNMNPKQGIFLNSGDEQSANAYLSANDSEILNTFALHVKPRRRSTKAERTEQERPNKPYWFIPLGNFIKFSGKAQQSIKEGFIEGIGNTLEEISLDNFLFNKYKKTQKAKAEKYKSNLNRDLKFLKNLCALGNRLFPEDPISKSGVPRKFREPLKEWLERQREKTLPESERYKPIKDS